MASHIKRDLEFEDIALHVENNHKTQCYVSFYSSCHKKEKQNSKHEIMVRAFPSAILKKKMTGVDQHCEP
jgi:hypothetical protein